MVYLDFQKVFSKAHPKALRENKLPLDNRIAPVWIRKWLKNRKQGGCITSQPGGRGGKPSSTGTYPRACTDQHTPN